MLHVAAQVHIPTLGMADTLDHLFETCRADPAVSTITLWVNRPGYVPKITERFPLAIVRYRPGKTIYQEWNEALDTTGRYEEDRIAVVLNDDVILPELAISNMVEKMLALPEFALVGFPYREQLRKGIHEVSGTFKDGGVGGFAWAAWPHRVARVDERFQWWYGDDDLVRRTIAKGERVGMVVGKPISHLSGLTAMHFDLASEIARDAALYRELWEGEE